MSAANCIRIFEAWLRANVHRFNGHEPALIKYTKKSARTRQTARFRFKGITSHLELWVQAGGGCVVTVNCKGENIDLIYDIDVYPERTETGRYFCSMCTPKYRRHYKSMEQLFIKEACDYLVKWANQNYVHSNRLMMVRMRGASWAKILGPRALRLKANRRSSDYSVFEIVNVLAGGRSPTSGNAQRKASRSQRG